MKISELLTDESKWCRCYFAKTGDDKHCASNDPAAKRWCLVGAIHVCYGIDEEISEQIYKKLGVSAATFNDTHTFADVRELVLELCI